LPGNGGPLPSVRKQIIQNAKQAGFWTGVKPSLRIKKLGGGRVEASIWSITNFGGPVTPIPHPTRMMDSSARFQVNHVTEGPIVTPIEQLGTVWQRVMRALQAGAAH
jgi:hypothetical protein